MAELRIEDVKLPEKITFNYDELKNEISEKAKMYSTLVYTESTISEAKADRANLNKLSKALNDERIRREKEYMKPFNEFKAKVNEIIAIIDEPIQIIDKQVKTFDEAQKAQKRDEVVKIYNDIDFPEWLKIEQIWCEKWLNKGSSLNSIREELKGIAEKVNSEVVTLNSMKDFGFEALEVYKSTLDLGKSLAEGKRLAEIQRRKEELSKITSEPVKAEEIKENVPTSEIPEKQEEKTWVVSFDAELTLAQAKELKQWFESHGVKYVARRKD